MREAAGRTLNRLFLWLSLAVILTHALIPLGSPAIRAQGSAFSAYTGDVSLRGREGSVARAYATQADPGEPGAGLPGGADPNSATPSIPSALTGPDHSAAQLHSIPTVRPSWAPYDAFRARAPPTAHR